MATANKEVSGQGAGAADTKNPKRVAAGKLNRAKRKGLSPQGRERLREAALKNRPWRFSTGPRSIDGKTRAARNNKVQQKGPLSVRELRSGLAELRALAADMREVRTQLIGVPETKSPE